MTCRELVELVTDYFDGALDEPTRVELHAHLALCSGCVHHMEQMRMTIRSAHDVKSLERRPEVVGLLEAFREWRLGRPSAG